jgi:hypothetical protein
MCDDVRVEDIEVLQKQIEQLQEQNKTLNDRVDRLESTLKSNFEEDVICDWLTRFYNEVLMKRLNEVTDVEYDSWEELSAALSQEYNGNPPLPDRSLKTLCCEATGLTEDDWDNCYIIKKTRNNRCHPRKTWSDAWSIVNRLDEGDLKDSLERVMLLLRKIGI